MSIRSSHMRFVRALVLGLAALSATAAQSAEEKLVAKQILGGRVSLSVPASFTLMSEELKVAKYPNANRPEVVYTDKRGTVNLAFAHTQQPLKPEQIVEAHKALDQQFHTMFPTAQWHDSKVFERDGRRFFLLDLTTPAADTQIRNTMVGTSLDGRLFMVTFNVTKELEAQWLPLGQKALATLKVKDK